MTATMREVAERAGVALVTVSRVINDHPSVSPATRAKVQAAIAELQYVPDQLASSLRSRQSGTLGLLLPTIDNAFWTAIARGVEDEAEAHGYSVIFCNTDDDAAKESRYLDVLASRRAEGIIVVPTIASAEQLRRVQQRQMPVMQVHRKLDELAADSIRADNRGGTAALTEQLLALGRRHVAFLGAATTISPARDCLGGYAATLTGAGIAIDPTIIKLGRARPETGYALTNELLRTTRPEALCIGNSRLAVGALHALREAGLRVPDDISVASFYDIAALDAYSPALIAAVQPAYDLGRLGARRLLDRIEGLDVPPADILLPVKIAAPPSAVANPSRLASVAD